MSDATIAATQVDKADPLSQLPQSGLKKVMLTEKGRENHEKLGEIFQKMDAQLEEGITEEELHAFMHVIDKVYYNMGKMKGENS